MNRPTRLILTCLLAVTGFISCVHHEGAATAVGSPAAFSAGEPAASLSSTAPNARPPANVASQPLEKERAWHRVLKRRAEPISTLEELKQKIWELASDLKRGPRIYFAGSHRDQHYFVHVSYIFDKQTWLSFPVALA